MPDALPFGFGPSGGLPVAGLDPADAAGTPDLTALLDVLRRSQGQTAPIWDPRNPVGTEQISPYSAQSVGMPRGPFDAIVDPSIARWPGRPMTQSEYQNLQDASTDLFNNAALLEGGGVSMPERVALAARRPLANPPPAPRLPFGAPASTVADIGGGQRGMMAVPSLRSMTPAEASVAAAPEPHIIPKPDGGYVGAPTWVQTPEHLQQMRDQLDAAIDAGAEGRDWYKNARGWISGVTGTGFDADTGASLYGNPSDARRMAEGLGAFSPQANPDTNLQFYLQARNAYMRGEPLPLVRNTQQATTYNTGMAAKDVAAAAGQPEPDIRLGPKTAPFGWHLSPDRPYGTTGVNDIWHARSFGYTNPDGSEFSGSPTTQQHMFMDYETQLAIDRANARASGGFTDWNAASIQAAPWVANKEAALREQYPNWTPERVHQEALSTFPDFAQRATAYMPHEQVPGKSTGLLDLLGEADKGPFSAASTWQDPTTRRDMLTGPLFHQPSMPNTTGTYRNSAGGFEMNPAQAAQPLVDMVAGTNPREIPTGTASALTGSSFARGLMDFQEGTPWHYVDTRGGQRVSDTSSMRLLGQRPTPTQLQALQDVADKHGYFLSDTGDGVSLLNAGSEKPLIPDGLPSPVNGIEQKARLNGGMQGEINQALPGAQIVPGRAQGNYADLSGELADSVKGQGRATSKVLAELEDMRTKAPRMYETLMDNPDVATKAQLNLKRLTPAMRTMRPDYVQLLQIIGGGNLRGLLTHVRNAGGAAGLPAALAALAPRGQDQSQ